MTYQMNDSLSDIMNMYGLYSLKIDFEVFHLKQVTGNNFEKKYYRLVEQLYICWILYGIYIE